MIAVGLITLGATVFVGVWAYVGAIDRTDRGEDGSLPTSARIALPLALARSEAKRKRKR